MFGTVFYFCSGHMRFACSIIHVDIVHLFGCGIVVKYLDSPAKCYRFNSPKTFLVFFSFVRRFLASFWSFERKHCYQENTKDHTLDVNLIDREVVQTVNN